MKPVDETNVIEAKKAVLEAALGICALSDLELCRRLELLYWKGFKAGADFVSEGLVNSINEHFSEPLDP